MSCAILLLLCSVLYAAGPQLNPQEIQADKGGSILLGGRVDFNEQMVADLYKGLTWLGTYHHGFECASPYEERLEFHQGNGSFSLRNLGEGDSGAYSYTVFQIINGKNNKIQMNFQVTVTERKAVTEQPSGTSTTDQRSVTSTNSASTNSANTSTNSTRTSRTFLSDFTGEQLPTCCNELMEISGSLSLSCVVFSAVFWLFYDNGKGATMTWCLSVIALILIGLNASPVVKWCTTPYGSGSRLPFCSVLGTSSQSPLVAQFRGYFSLLLVSLFSLCTILGFYLT
ncbi:hypothetical protein XENTR_v10000224 [Xenopus tropicalis]|nr:hypothetical protein XENTR_v10000224 [Xenopus tropicalis]